jgi:hypothetical protein
MDKIKEKIQKLMALQVDAEKQGSLEEAANAACKVQDLLLKHNLAMAEVEGHKVQTMNRVTSSASDIGWNKRQGQWLMGLYNGLAKYNFCRVILTQYPRDVKIHVMGELQNVEVVNYLGAQLAQRVLNLEKQGWNLYQGSDKRGTFRRGYLMGTVMGIISQLREQREAASRASASVASLVLVQSEAVQEYVEQEFPDTKTQKRSKTKSNAVGLGYVAGQALDVHKGIGSNTSQKEIR